MAQNIESSRKKLLFSNKDLTLLIWPLLVEQLLQITLGMADIIMVSSLGEASVSGVSLVDQINILLVQVFAALGTGGAVVCSQYIGRGDREMASKTAKQLLYTITSFALLILFAGIIAYKPLLRIIFGNVEADVMKSSQKYFLITLFALPSIALYNGCASLFRAEGNSKISMLTALLVNILNIGGNAVMIYGMKSGVEGVAIPTLISRTIAAIILFVLLYRPSSSATISIKNIFNIEIDWHIIARILKIGIPNGMENSTFQIGKILVLSLIATYGTSAIAANAATNTLASFQVLPGTALGLAVLTVIGQCMGAGEVEQACLYTKKLMFITYIFMWALNIPLLFLYPIILKLYNMTPLTQDLARLMVMTHGISAMVIWPISFVLPNVLRAAGDASFTMVISMISMWTVRVGMSYLFKYTGILGLVDALSLPYVYGSWGIWIAMIIDWIVRSVLFLYRYLSGVWKKKHII